MLRSLLRACEPLISSREQHHASFETAASRLPQDDDIFNAINHIRHPEERPEGASRRTHDASAADTREPFRFFHSLSGWRLTTVCSDPAADQPADLVDPARDVLVPPLIEEFQFGRRNKSRSLSSFRLTDSRSRPRLRV